MTASTIKIVVADDHPVYRNGLRALLDQFEEVEVVGLAATGREAVEVVARTRPDVVLMDLRMPELDGIEATREIRNDQPDVAVVVLTMMDDDESVFAAVKAGARGYLLKEAEAAEVRRAVHAAADGEAIFGARIARRLADYFAAAAAPVPATPFPELTTGERAVLDMMAGGLANNEIARRLMLSPKTVRNRVSAIFAKLRLRDRAEAIVRARDAGLGRSR
jgi:DNA-binding NarL/FixJ family response regulator